MDLDINDLRALYTVLMFLVFIGVCWWAYSSRSRPRFDAAARLPFEEPEYPRQDPRPETTPTSSGDRT